MVSPKRSFICGEDGHGNTARKSNHDGVGNILDYGTQLQKTEQQQEHASHDGGYHQSLYAILLYYAVDDDNESAGGSAYLHLAAAEQRDYESGDYGGDDAFLQGLRRRRCRMRWQAAGGDNTYDDASHDVGCQGLSVYVLRDVRSCGFRLNVLSSYILNYILSVK